MPDVPVWPKCNINCLFCSNPAEGYRESQDDYTFEVFAKKWSNYLKGKVSYYKFNQVDDFISLTGGEPTIHPDFFKILGFLRKSWPDRDIKLMTNARVFRYEDFAKKCLRLGGRNFEIYTPLCGYNAKTHEAITRTPGSFDDTYQGIKNVLKFKTSTQKIGIRIILNKLQMPALKKMVQFINREFSGIDGVDLIFIELEGIASKNAGVLKMSMKECALEIERIRPFLEKLPRFSLFHFPVCVLPKGLWSYTWRTLDPKKVIYADVCKKCKMADYCVGIHRSYVKEFGLKDFKAFETMPKVVISSNKYHPIVGL
jgi:MoaA/NifB/PqqE/SkfB family radical SAM enzyme